MRLEPGCYLRHGRIARLVFADPNEAAATCDLEGTSGPVDGVGNIHGPSLKTGKFTVCYQSLTSKCASCAFAA
jgi:hypothetical protein